MGVGETNKTGKDKDAKTPSISNTQEQPPATMQLVNQDWSGFQAYSPLPPHGYMASSPQTHPYMWGVQHIMPPYGTPPHPYVMYPHGGMYAHPSMPPGSYPFSPFAMPSPNGIPEASGNTPIAVEGDARPSDAKEKLPVKRSKGSLGSLNAITGKKAEHNKTRPAPANGMYQKSAESGSEGSSEGTDENSQNESNNKSGAGPDSLEDTSQNCGSQNGHGNSNPIVSAPMAIVPISSTGTVPTNLNIGMDYWGAQSLHGKVSTGSIVPSNPRDGVQSQLLRQDERELKKQRRKQSNRESARRSRLRKQAECDELAQRAGALKEENDNLRLKISRIKSEFEELSEENASLKESIASLNKQSEGNNSQES